MSALKFGIFITAVILMVSPSGVYASKKIKKKTMEDTITNSFIEECTSKAGLSEDKAFKCSLDLSKDVDKLKFYKFYPKGTVRGDFEKKSDFDLRCAAAYDKWEGRHVIFKAYNSNESIVYDRDAEIVRFSIENSKDVKIKVGEYFKVLGTYRASNAFGTSRIVTKTHSEKYYIYDNEFSGFSDIEFPMLVDDAKKNLSNLIVLYEVVLELRPYKYLNDPLFKLLPSSGDICSNDVEERDTTSFEPTMDAPYESEDYEFSFYVKIEKIMIVNKASGKVLATARSKGE